MSAVSEKRERQHFIFNRNMFLAGAIAYFLWWFASKALLPNSFNPLGSRLVVVACFFVCWILSFYWKYLQNHMILFLSLCMGILTTHYFYLFHNNYIDINWVVGSYITAITICLCLQHSRALLYYSLYTLFLSISMIVTHKELMNSVFLPGMVTILLFANFGIRSRMQFLRQIEENSQRVQSLFDAVFEGIVLHKDGIIVEVNQGFANIFRCKTSDLVGKYLLDFIAPSQRHQFRMQMENNFELASETTGMREDGSLIQVEYLSKRHSVKGEIHAVVAFHDITEKKKAEKDRIGYEATKEALRIRDEFISIASHELKTPLTSIKLQTQIAKKALERNEKPDTSRLIKLTDHVNRQTDRLALLVEDMLDISRISMGKFLMKEEKLDLSQVCKNVVEIMQESFTHERCVLQADIEENIFIKGDSFRIEQLLMNFLSNALKYGDRKPVKLELKIKENRALISVTDQGIGIERENQERIFHKFERAVSARNISGLGLGLFISKQIADAHHGEISVFSQIGQGSRFEVSLPVFVA